jgi:hypothetical protein
MAAACQVRLPESGASGGGPGGGAQAALRPPQERPPQMPRAAYLARCQRMEQIAG